MRHRIAGRRLSRTSSHRLAMRRNMVQSLFEHERISTTIQKAKEVRGFAEKLITLAKKGDLAARRRAISLLGNRDIIAYEDGQSVKKGTVVGKLFSEIGPRYLDRSGGYTRIIKLVMRRLGDNGEVVLLQLIGADEEKAEKKSGKGTNKRAKRTTVYEEMTGKLKKEEKQPEEAVEAKEEVVEQAEAEAVEKQPDEAEEAEESAEQEGSKEDTKEQ